jgi:BlaI family penicillinase repressor
MDELSLGERELDVMAVLWEIESGTAAEVRDLLPTDLAYNTVLTLLRRLEVKGFLRREAEGKAHRYYPTVERREAQDSALGQLIDRLFAGSPEQLVAHLVDDRKLSGPELDRLRKRLRELSRGGRRR